jgi:hypothetical protein
VATAPTGSGIVQSTAGAVLFASLDKLEQQMTVDITPTSPPPYGPTVS